MKARITCLALLIVGVSLAGCSTPATAPTTTPVTTPSASASPSPSAAADGEAQLVVAGANIDVTLIPEGLDDSGKINPEPGTAIWFTGYDRVFPGEVGTAVVAGHVVADDKPDVFADLGDIAVGDTFEITAGEAVTKFVVTRAVVQTKDETAADVEVWGANDSTRRVVLVTCSDTLGFRDDGHRVANYVVVAEAENE